MLKVGITGGIGSGKTTICQIFESLDIPVYYADERAKWLMSNDLKLVSGIKTHFGVEAYFPDGSLNRNHISNMVFKNSSKLSTLNALVHPAVAADAEIWFDKQKNAPYALKEAALLVESKSYLSLDRLIVVAAPLELRIQRVMNRDGVDKQKVEERIGHQMPEEDKLKYADFIINNDGIHLLLPQVINIHRILLSFNA
ncbi:MAG: dephospho-CoA kinase [Saprospiraceae bacterium]